MKSNPHKCTFSIMSHIKPINHYHLLYRFPHLHYLQLSKPILVVKIHLLHVHHRFLLQHRILDLVILIYRLHFAKLNNIVLTLFLLLSLIISYLPPLLPLLLLLILCLPTFVSDAWYHLGWRQGMIKEINECFGF